MILVIFLYALCASMFTIAKAVLLYAQPVFFIGIRMLAAGALLLGFDRVRLGRFYVIAKDDWWLFIQLILFHVYVVYVFDLLALQYMTSARSALWYSLTPFFTAGIAYFVLSERLTTKRAVGLAIGFAGMLFEVLAEVDIGQLSPKGIYDLYMLLAVGAGAYGWIVFKQLQLRPAGYSTFFINGLAMFVGGLMALATSALFEQWHIQSPVTHVLNFLLLTGLIVVLGNVMYYSLYGYLLRFYTNTFLAFAGFLCPLFAALFGWFFLHEPLSWRFFVSVGFVCFGLYLFYQDELHT